jgi:hypothetical protein
MEVGGGDYGFCYRVTSILDQERYYLGSGRQIDQVSAFHFGECERLYGEIGKNLHSGSGQIT